MRVILYNAGKAVEQFNLGRYSNKADLIQAIEALPMITTRGNDIVGAMRMLLNRVLAYGWRGHEHWIQKVALVFTDERAPNSRDLEEAFQVLCYDQSPVVGQKDQTINTLYSNYMYGRRPPRYSESERPLCFASVYLYLYFHSTQLFWRRSSDIIETFLHGVQAPP